MGYVVDDLVDWEKLLKGLLGGTMIAGGVGGIGSQAINGNKEQPLLKQKTYLTESYFNLI